MKTTDVEKLREEDGPAKTLVKVLGQNEHVKNIVEQCAVELSSTNVALKNELADLGSSPGVERALEKTKPLKSKYRKYPKNFLL